MSAAVGNRSLVTSDEAVKIWTGIYCGKNKSLLKRESVRGQKAFHRVFKAHAAFELLINRSVASTGRPPGDTLKVEQLEWAKDKIGYDIEPPQVQTFWAWYVPWRVCQSETVGPVPLELIEPLLDAMRIPRFCGDLAPLKVGADGPQRGRLDGRDLKWRLENRKITALWHDAVEAARLRRALANSGADAGLKIMLTERFEALVRDGCDHLNEAADQAASEATNPWTMTVAKVENVILSGGYHPNDPEFVRLDRLSRKAHVLNGDIARWAEDYRRAISG